MRKIIIITASAYLTGCVPNLQPKPATYVEY